MQYDYVQGKVLAIRNLHYYSKKNPLGKKNPYEDRNVVIEQSAAAYNTPIEHSYSYLEAPFLKNPGYTPCNGNCSGSISVSKQIA